jgi:hypothetical protein
MLIVKVNVTAAIFCQVWPLFDFFGSQSGGALA